MSLAIISRILESANDSLQTAPDSVVCSKNTGLRLCSICKSDVERVSSTIITSTFRNISSVAPGRNLQIIGDSLPAYDRDSREVLIRAIDSLINDFGITSVIYGLTGKVGVNGCVDINQIVNEWLDDDPKIRSRYVWGVVSDIGTVDAISKHEYTVSDKCVNFIVVTGGASFGDEIRLTDAMTDVLLIAEGGVQSFCQAVNVLARPNTTVYAYPDLRSGDSPARFSAARFLHYIKTHCRNLSPDLLDRFCLSVPPLSGIQQTQLRSAWAQFLESNLSARIPDIIFRYR
jgi:hypothetical protein